MHRVDTDGNVSNLFDEGDPLVPRLPTQVDAAILNAFQEELANAITTAGVALVKGTNNQLASVMMNLSTVQHATANKTFGASISSTGAAGGEHDGVVGTGSSVGGRGGRFQGTDDGAGGGGMEGVYAKGASDQPGAVLEGAGIAPGVRAKAATNAQAAAKVDGWIDVSGSNTPTTAADKMLTPQGVLRAACRFTTTAGSPPSIAQNSGFNVYDLQIDGSSVITLTLENTAVGTELWIDVTDFNTSGANLSIQHRVISVDASGTGGRTRITLRPLNVSTGAFAAAISSAGAYVMVYSAN